VRIPLTAHTDDANSSRGPWRAREPRLTFGAASLRGPRGRSQTRTWVRPWVGLRRLDHGLTGLWHREPPRLAGGGSFIMGWRRFDSTRYNFTCGPSATIGGDRRRVHPTNQVADPRGMGHDLTL